MKYAIYTHSRGNTTHWRYLWWHVPTWANPAAGYLWGICETGIGLIMTTTVLLSGIDKHRQTYHSRDWRKHYLPKTGRLDPWLQYSNVWYRKAISFNWGHNGHDGVSNHQPCNCLLNRYLGADQRKHQSSSSLAFVRGIHRWLENSAHKGPVTRKMFPFDDAIMAFSSFGLPRCECIELLITVAIIDTPWLILMWKCG